MNSMRHTVQTAWGWKWLSARARSPLGALLLLLIAKGLTTTAQETNPLLSPRPEGRTTPPGSATTPTNPSEPLLTRTAASTNGLGFGGNASLSSSLTESNRVPLTNALGETNLAAPPTALGGTNSPGTTNSLGETNAPATTNDSAAPTNSAETTGAPPTNDSASAGATNAPVRRDYAYFQFIPERNIFNANRRPRGSRQYDRPRYQRPGARTESFALVGTMSYDKGPVAFFDGSSYEYRKALKPAESVAGYTVAEIGPNWVKLGQRTNLFEMRIGMQMRREEGGEWNLNASTEVAATAAPAGPTESSAGGETNAPSAETGSPSVAGEAPAAATNAAPAAASASESEILKKLMQRREQELTK